MGQCCSSQCSLPCWTNIEPVGDVVRLSRVLSKKELLSMMQTKKIPFSAFSQAVTSSSSSTTELFLLDESSSGRESSPSPAEELGYVQTANRLYQKGELQGSINNYMIALHKVQRRDVRMADIHFTIAQCYFSMGNFNTALKHCKLAQAKYAQLTGKTSEGVAMTCNLIGHIHTQINDFILAQHYYEKAYQIFREAEDSNYKNLLQVGFNLAALYLNIDKDGKAFQVYQQLEQLVLIDKKIAKELTIIQLYRCMGINSFKLESYKKSLEYFQKAFDISLRISSVKNAQVFKLINSFKIIYNYIITAPSLKKLQLTRQILKKFAQLNRRM